MSRELGLPGCGCQDRALVPVCRLVAAEPCIRSAWWSRTIIPHARSSRPRWTEPIFETAWLALGGAGSVHPAEAPLTALCRSTLYPVGLVEPHHHPSCKVVEAQVDRTHL